ncbi:MULTISPECIES: DNA/RNA non-specific endonuclease [unclassified Mucilaginibacter]|uniref:DNA/RNA non-specific endonuclease n=1 Tax=unclassified Mucilaginibacter TaxID=2617802 RepID=UPI002AC9DECC|nr:MULTISPECIES: DNA/RNA non-specific endonuclease [unclassified Mucilaginibacter]MEB0261686.1 DNA/RNA non-specific endonuclease [Mucilaginibacter sp. 10I4]MEB0278336.1 DNA/RNA non-specific endonuclease [Mucilaginibacter sp. 10B2]MEB0303200.1 DNA/RNA non-specific endonuclease [Mucilaginibacter sp. 5C4]WPX23981.1 DNA/RNA non-specific endonuclease [Mucilaginibacter sp. 5C4]
MKIKKLLIYSALVLAIASCKKDNNSTQPITPPVVVVPEAPKPYAITEGFETGSKTSYAVADVQLNTGLWSFNDGLIGSLAADVKNGAKSVRLRTGDLTMKFDINGVEQISIKHAKYGTDATSTWQLMISEDGGATYTQLGANISETSTTLVADSFKVTTTKPVRFRIQKTGTTRINLDDITFKGKGDAGIIVGPPDTSGDGDGSTDPGTGTGTPTAERGVTVGADAPPDTGDNSNILLGNPSGAQPAIVMVDNYLIDQGYYTESYSSTRGTPNWVSWHLDATNITNSAPRVNNFAGFIGLSNTFYHVESNSYSGSGFDRGHNCPSADRTSSADANSATFLMTNMIPQAPNNNQQTWANMENYLRTQVVAGNEVYIIMGNYGTGGTGSKGTVNKINNDHITVPSNVWKVAVIVPTGDSDLSRVTSNTRVIAVNTPNINTTNSDWKQYRVTVRDIENATGYNLLSNLPQSVQDAVETKKDVL